MRRPGGYKPRRREWYTYFLHCCIFVPLIPKLEPVRTLRAIEATVIIRAVRRRRSLVGVVIGIETPTIVVAVVAISIILAIGIRKITATTWTPASTKVFVEIASWVGID